jgi:superfamily II DNA helicase RecQ
VLGLNEAKRFILGFDRPNISFEVRRCDGAGSAKGSNFFRARKKSDSKKMQILNELLGEGEGDGDGSSIIYCALRKNTEAVVEELNASGHSARAYHAGLPAAERSLVQEGFMAGTVKVI